MATFAPQIPESVPEYLRYDRGPISEIPVNKSGEILGKGLGQTIEEGAKTADHLVGEYFEKKSLDAGDKIMDEEMAKYEPVYRQLNNIPEDKAVDPAALKSSLMDTISGAELPPEVKNGIKMAENAQGISNKANNTFDATYAKMRVRSTLKDLRSLAPGYRKPIDQGMERATGMAGANEAYNSILTNINSYITKAQEEKNKEMTQVFHYVSAGLIDKEDLNGYLSGKLPFHELMGKVLEGTRAKTHDEDDKRKLENAKISAEEKTRVATESMDRKMYDTVNNIYGKVALRSGDGTMDNLIQKLNDMASGKIKVTDQTQITPLLQALKQGINDATQQLQSVSQAGYSGATATGATFSGKYSDFIDPKKLQERIGDHIKRLTEISNAFEQGNYSLASQLAQHVKDVQQNASYVLHTSDAGKLGALISEANKMDPLFGKGVYDNLKTNYNLDSKYKPFIEDYISRFTTQPAKAKGEVSTFYDAVKDLKARGAKDPQIYDALLSSIEKIPNAVNDEVVRNMALSFFDPSNIPVISRFAKDSLDIGLDGNVSVKPGQVDIFRRMLSPDVLKRIYALNDPDLNNKVKTFAENAFGFGILRDTLKDFQQVQIERGSRITWNDETHQFGLDTSEEKNAPLMPSDIARMRRNPTRFTIEHLSANTTDNPRVRMMLGNINRAINSIAPIAEHSGQTPTQYMFDLLKANGIDFTDKPPKGLPEAMMKSLGAERAHRELEQKMKEMQRKESVERSK